MSQRQPYPSVPKSSQQRGPQHAQRGSTGNAAGPDDWAEYPKSLPSFDAYLYDAEHLQQQVQALGATVFDPETEVGFVDAFERNQYTAAPTTLCRQDDVIRHATSCSPDFRIIFLRRKHSLSSLLISKELLLKILRHHEIGPCFLDLLFAFQPLPGLDSCWSSAKAGKFLYELCYQFRFMEKNHHTQGTPWSERQVGIYHRFGRSVPSTMIFLGSKEGRARQRIQQAFAKGLYKPQEATSPLAIHVMVISSYIDQWRLYLRAKGDECRTEGDILVTIRLEHPSVTFGALQQVRDLESQMLAARTILRSLQTVIQTLWLCGRGLLRDARMSTGGASSSHDEDDLTLLEDPQMRSLEVLRLKTEGYLESLDVIQRRIDVLVGLLSDGLSERSQHTANAIADSSRELTLKSLNDSYIVKVVTIITLIYLPMQGVATFFGMNLTALPSETNRLLFAKNWWLFVATAIPLTLLTLFGLLLAMMLENRKKNQKREQMRQRP